VAPGAFHFIAGGRVGFEISRSLAANGYRVRSPGGYSIIAALVIEIIMTFMFVIIILGALVYGWLFAKPQANSV
jgi:aquaporin Z